MERIEVKRGTTTISIPAKNLEWYEERGYKKPTKRGRKPAAKTSAE